MTADLLRRAAMRAQELADGATPGPWETGSLFRGWSAVLGEGSRPVCETTRAGDPDAELIAACDPPFLRAVGEWLEQHALDHVSSDCQWHFCNALPVAYALLGESPRITQPPADSSQPTTNSGETP